MPIEPPELARTALPIADLAYTGVVTFDATSADTKYPPIRRLRPPAGAPNVLVVLIDDVGFGASSGHRHEFTGTLNWVRIDLGDDSHDHLDPEGKLQAALIEQ